MILPFFLYNKKVRLVPRVAGENPEKNVRFLDKMSRIPRIWSREHQKHPSSWRNVKIKSPVKSVHFNVAYEN